MTIRRLGVGLLAFLALAIIGLFIPAPAVWSQVKVQSGGAGGSGGGGVSLTCAALDTIIGGGPLNYITVACDGAALEVDWDATVLMARANDWTGLNSYTPSTTQSITGVGTAVLCNANNVKIDPDGTYTATVTPTVANGTDGTTCRITNIDTALSWTWQDEANLAGSNLRCGGSDVTIGPRGYRDFTYTTSVGDWACAPAGASVLTPSDMPVLSSTTDLGYFWNTSGTGMPQAASTTTVFSATTPRYYQFVIPYAMTITKLGLYVNVVGASGTSGLAMGLFDSACNSVVQATTLTGLNSLGAKVLTVASTTLTPGVYYLGLSSDDTSVVFSGSGLGTVPQSILNTGTIERWATGSNAVTGSGSTLALPAACGTLTSYANVPPHVALMP